MGIYIMMKNGLVEISGKTKIPASGSGSGLIINVTDMSVFDQNIYNTAKIAIEAGTHVVLVEGGVDSYIAYKSDGGIHFVNSVGYTDWFEDGEVHNGQYVTSDNINDLIALYMATNYEDGNTGKY